MPRDVAGSPDWVRYADFTDHSDARTVKLFPDFLVVSPGRSATTWLFECLRIHPQIVIPKQKEIRYFDFHWRNRNLSWYCSLFERATDQVAGDVSPTYALLPSFAVQQIARLNPRLKVVILLREPMSRAWSHCKHMLHQHEANFADYKGDVGGATVGDFVRNLTNDFALSFADYISIIRRWSTYFPSDQIHLELFENAIENPLAYLTDLLRFLGVKESFLPRGSYPLWTKVNASSPELIPVDLQIWLMRLFYRRRTEIEIELRKLGLKPCWTSPFSGLEDWGAAILPDPVDGYEVELDNGWFLARCTNAKPPDAVPTGEARERYHRAEFLGDLRTSLQMQERDELINGAAFWSQEDRRLIGAIDLVPPLATIETRSKPSPRTACLKARRCR